MLKDRQSGTSQNEDVIVLFLNVLHKSSNETQHHGLDILRSLIKDSITNRTSCFKAGALSYLLDWFSVEERDDVCVKIAQLIQIIGGHSISGKDIRKIFALLRGDKVGSKQSHSSLLLSSVGYMLKEKGPEAFFEFSGHDYELFKWWPLQELNQSANLGKNAKSNPHQLESLFLMILDEEGRVDLILKESQVT